MVIVEDEGERFWYSDSEKLDGHCRCLTNMLPHILRTDFQTKKAKRKTTYWSLNFVPSVIRGNQHILNKAMVIGNWPMVVSLWWPTFNKPVLFFFCLRWISLIQKYLRMRSYHERILWTRVYSTLYTRIKEKSWSDTQADREFNHLTSSTSGNMNIAFFTIIIIIIIMMTMIRCAREKSWQWLICRTPLSVAAMRGAPFSKKSNFPLLSCMNIIVYGGRAPSPSLFIFKIMPLSHPHHQNPFPSVTTSHALASRAHKDQVPHQCYFHHRIRIG